MATTYEAIASYTVPSSASSYTFTSIPQTYTDLILIINGTASSADNALDMQVGNTSIDTGSNYSTTAIYGTGSAAASYRATGDTKMDIGRADTTSGASIIHIQSYSNTTTYKTILSRGNDSSLVIATVNLWRSTSAINTIKVGRFSSGGTISTNTTLALYGIKAA